MSVQRDGSTWSTGIILIGAAVFATLLAFPRMTVTASYVNDLFIFLDGAHRIDSGQLPNRDFHTPLGPLAFYIPTWGYWLSGSMGAAMPWGMALTTLAVAVPSSHVLSSRLRPVLAIPFGLFLVLVLASPLNLGEGITALSFAMFYNRIGWVALSVLLVMYLPSRRCDGWQTALDALSATALITLMLYLKITYGLVAIAFLAFLLFIARQRSWALAAIALVAVGTLIIEFFWRSSASYLHDLALSARVSGSRGVANLIRMLGQNLADFILLGFIATLVLFRRRRVCDVLFFGFCTLPGLWIQNQNSQPSGVLTLHAGAAVAVEFLLRTQGQLPSHTRFRSALAAGIPLLFTAMILPILIHCLLALGLHTALAIANAGQAFDLPRFHRVRLISPWLSDDKTLMHTYLASIEDGARALESLPEEPKKVSVLDFANPFSAALDLPPPRGDGAWLHWDRNISSKAYIAPERYFADVEVLMLPKWGINPAPLRDLYGSYIDRVFEPLSENEGWVLYRRRRQEVSTKAF